MAANKPANTPFSSGSGSGKKLTPEQVAARKAQLAKERRTQTIIGVVVVAVLVIALAVVSVIVWRNTHPNPVDTAKEEQQLTQALDAVKVRPENMTAASDHSQPYGFLISKDGLGKPVSGVPTVDIYMDFICPACGMADQALDSTFIGMVNAGQLNVVLHPLGFLDRSSTDNYSTRSAAMAAYIIQHDPAHALAFVQAMFAADFQPQEATDYKSKSNQDIANRAIQAGVSKEVATAAMNGHADTSTNLRYTPWVQALSAWTPTQDQLKNIDGDFGPNGSRGWSMTTPTFLINNTYWSQNTALNSLGNNASFGQLPTAFLKAIGMDQSQVGMAGHLPSLGTKTPTGVGFKQQ